MTDTSVGEEETTRRTDDGEPFRIISMGIISACSDHEASRIEIDHTRKIGEKDLLHELVHALNPNLPHEQIDVICRELITARKKGDAQELISRLQLGLS